MMPRATYRWYRFACSGLLTYLFLLNVVGFSHNHDHSASETFNNHYEAQFFSDDNCSFCDWLVNHTYCDTSSPEIKLVTYSEDECVSADSSSGYFFYFYKNRPSRGPPTFS